MKTFAGQTSNQLTRVRYSIKALTELQSNGKYFTMSKQLHHSQKADMSSTVDKPESMDTNEVESHRIEVRSIQSLAVSPFAGSFVSDINTGQKDSTGETAAENSSYQCSVDLMSMSNVGAMCKEKPLDEALPQPVHDMALGEKPDHCEGSKSLDYLKRGKLKSRILDVSLLRSVTKFVRDNPGQVINTDCPEYEDRSSAQQLVFETSDLSRSSENLVEVLPFAGHSGEIDIPDLTKDSSPGHGRRKRKPKKRKRKDNERTEHVEFIEVLPFSGVAWESDISDEKMKTPKSKQKENKTTTKKSVKDKRLSPSHFLAIQITNPQIIAGVKCLQKYIVAQKVQLKPIMIPLATLHLTMGVMPLYQEDQLKKACQILEEYCKDLNTKSDEPIVFTMKGVGHFHNKVLFACVEDGPGKERLLDLAGDLHHRFSKEGLLAPEDIFSRDNFQLHLTLAKMSRFPRLKKLTGIKHIDPALYSGLSEEVFGVQTVRGIQLCSMMKRKDTEGYYHQEHAVNWGSHVDPMLGPDTIVERISEKLQNLETYTDDVLNPHPKRIRRSRQDQMYSLKLEKNLVWKFHQQTNRNTEDKG